MLLSFLAGTADWTAIAGDGQLPPEAAVQSIHSHPQQHPDQLSFDK